MSKMKTSSALALLILLNLSFVLGKSVRFHDCGRSFLSLSFFSTCVQNLVPLLIQEHTEGTSVTLLLY